MDLETMTARRPPRQGARVKTLSMMTRGSGVLIAVTSGKGGVGKTTLTVNVAVSLARLGHRVAVVDADFGLGNVDIQLGLTTRWHVGHLLSGERTLDGIAVDGPFGIKVVPAGSGSRRPSTLTATQWQLLTGALNQLRREHDFVLIDMATGICDNVIEMALLADRVLLVTSSDPAALVNSYGLAKALMLADPACDLGVVVNTVRSEAEGIAVHEQLDRTSTRFLNRRITYHGYVPEDIAVQTAVRAQLTVADHAPQSDATRCVRQLAQRLAGAPARPEKLRLVTIARRHQPSEVLPCA